MELLDNSEIKARPLYQGLMGAAVVAAVFAGIASVLLAIAGYQITVVAPQKAAALLNMQQELQTRSYDETLINQIRTLDEQIRRDELRRQRFIGTGGLYFAGSMVIAVICFLATRLMLSPAPTIPAEETCTGQQIQDAARVRFAVTVATVILAAGGLYVILTLSSPKPASVSVSVDGPLAQADWAQMVQGRWPSFRGPWGLGIADFNDIPAAWNEKENQGIIFKSEIPLPGHSSPIVWDNRVFVSGANASEQKLFCYDAEDGKLLWTGQIKPAGTEHREPLEIMEDTGFAACTPVTNGRQVLAVFATGDIGCFDVDGKVLWQKALGVPESAYGYASSPAVMDAMAIVQFDQGSEEGKSELIAYNLADGAILWRTRRPTPNTWTSPTLTKMDREYQILTSGSPWVIGYEPQTGNELWRAECLGSDVAPTQITAGGLILAIQPYDKLYAIRLQEPSKALVAWSAEGDMPDICSPVSNGQRVWTLTTVGGLSCFNVSDGAEVYTASLEGEFNASPVLVGEKLYILSRKGEMIIADAGREYKEITRCTIEEHCFASPAFKKGRVYLRSDKSLYGIGKSR